ncbi:MAG: sialate O-acetylesterase [Acidobacteriota bacterium]|nr:sialate O-acetylesterase [Acidobacteriota bacterium]
MVVQRGLPVHIWGQADPGEGVTVSFRGAERSATAGPLGQWSVFLPPGDAGGPFRMTINSTVFDDVLVGDVWIASGQSNMEWPLAWAADSKATIAAARHPRIRLVRAMHKVSDYPVENLVGEMWRECSPASAEKFSAAAYHFGRLLEEKLHIPIGLIQTAWGGTPLDAWTSLRAISRDPALMPVLAEWDRLMREYPLELLRYGRAARDWENLAAQRKAQHQPLPPAPEKPAGPAGPWKPGALFNAMVAPITPMPIRGVIWYQGEANGGVLRAPYYGRLFQAMITDWRRAWGIGDFPFLFVQLANYNAPDSDWPTVREGQREALALRNTAMAVTIDIGTPDNIHPPDKRTVGERLSLAARALAYGEAIEYSGPAPRQVTRAPGELRVWFDHAAGLAARGDVVRGFEVAGIDREYYAADARIEGETVVLRSAPVPDPVFVRYGWRDNPACNLFNAAGLPASPFRRE